eukprot:GHVL01015858.1.p1 GENE.GHVL01015858.1~~GHVL01015858.1.p1  ORF type:complete len:109 (+),score=25.31 GHVL01015858.1:225-551(+)
MDNVGSEAVATDKDCDQSTAPDQNYSETIATEEDYIKLRKSKNGKDPRFVADPKIPDETIMATVEKILSAGALEDNASEPEELVAAAFIQSFLLKKGIDKAVIDNNSN